MKNPDDQRLRVVVAQSCPPRSIICGMCFADGMRGHGGGR